jgi:hypothetical protein
VQVRSGPVLVPPSASQGVRQLSCSATDTGSVTLAMTHPPSDAISLWIHCLAKSSVSCRGGFRVVTAEPDLILPLALDGGRVILAGFGFNGIGRLKRRRVIPTGTTCFRKAKCTPAT